jgi:hypothetical protein
MSSPQQQINTGISSGASTDDSIFNSLTSKFYISLITVGIILLFATIGSTSMDSLNGTIAGYFLIAIGMAILISFIIGISSKNGSQNIISAIFSVGPFFVTIGIVAYILYLLFTYKDRIAQGNIAPGYANFTNISVILILLQLFLFYMGTQKQSFQRDNKLDRVYSGLLYFVGVINIVAVITIGIILKYFSTDG